MRIKTPVCQIVGYKNTGKTTFMSKLIKHYTSAGLRVGALKHHGHGGEPEALQGTDSARHSDAGAHISGVQGESIVQLSLETEEPMELMDILAIYELSKPDIILIEGYKDASFPKVVLLNEADEAEDEQLLEKVTHPIAIGSMDTERLHNRKLFTIPLLEIDNHMSEIAAYIQNKVF